MAGTNQQYDHNTLKQAVGSSTTQSWKDTTNKLQQSAKSGSIPQNYSEVGQTAEKMYSSLSSEQQNAIDQMPSEVQTAVFQFLGYVNNLGQNNRTQAQAIAQFISNCTTQASSPR